MIDIKSLTSCSVTDIDGQDALPRRAGSVALELICVALEPLGLGLVDADVGVLGGLVVDEVVLDLAGGDVAVVELAVGRDAPGGGVAVGVPEIYNYVSRIGLAIKYVAIYRQ